MNENKIKEAARRCSTDEFRRIQDPDEYPMSYMFMLENGIFPFIANFRSNYFYDLNRFINDLKKTYKGMNYIWKFETSEKYQSKYSLNLMKGLDLHIFMAGSVFVRNHETMLLSKISTECFSYASILYDPELSVEIGKIKTLLEKNHIKESYTDKEVNIGIVSYESSYGYNINEIDISNKIRPIVMPDLHYGTGFKNFYEKMLQRLINSDSGLVLFYGEPGTGKTYCVRNIIHDLNEHKYFVYVPSNLITQLLDPTFFTFLYDNTHSKGDRNIVLIIEDAESILMDRKGNDNPGVSNLLNLSDGILNDILGIQVIATFNIGTEFIDKAVMRPGRLIAMKEFQLLTEKQAAELIAQKGLKVIPKNNMPLAEIYSSGNNTEVLYHYCNGTAQKEKVGFI